MPDALDVIASLVREAQERGALLAVLSEGHLSGADLDEEHERAMGAASALAADQVRGLLTGRALLRHDGRVTDGRLSDAEKAAIMAEARRRGIV